MISTPSSYFNPRAPCGARRGPDDRFHGYTMISIHAPHAGRDFGDYTVRVDDSVFQSTRPMRGATAKVYKITLHTFATKGNS